ncbi:hypothetical protein EST38_g5426 [Candolleomyces aberdarensis]|uniref:Uncharacterized protein n=1 Tax=Candolleomyces aberdarensis TaxID=2316362 RepID=A0A4Q2DKL6_9AGAR|nr:hypothetical protein EST38_g5426 [Candolleomyces aberdarensis]
MLNNSKDKAPEVQPSTCLEQQPVATDEQQQPVAGPSTMLVPATFSDYSFSPSPDPSASSSERHYSSEPYDHAATAGYSGYASPAASVETGDDYYPSLLNLEREAASVGGSRGGTSSSVPSASSSGLSSGSPSSLHESSVGVDASPTGSRSASIPPPLPLQAHAGPSLGNSDSDDFIKQGADVDWTHHPLPQQQPQDQVATPSGAGNFDLTQYPNTSNENAPQQAGGAAGLEDTRSSIRRVGTQPWMPEMIQEPKGAKVAHCAAFLTADDALEHLKLHQTDIIKAMNSPEISMIALAGFNEGLVQQGTATLLQEIHIMLSRDIKPPQHVVDAVGKACSPFPSMVFMPSGTTFRPPVFNAEGKPLTFEDLIPPPSASQHRFNVALGQGQTSAGHKLTAADHLDQPPSDNGHDGQSQGERFRSSPTEARRVQPRSGIPRGSDSVDGLQPGEEGGGGDDDGTDSASRDTATREDENAPIANAQGGEHLPPSQGPPVPGDGGTTQRPHNIHFDITAAIYQPSPGSGLLQELQLTGKFNFQLTPGRTSSVEFTRMQCQAHKKSNAPYEYSQNYLKILIDSHSPQWSLEKHKPKSTRASDGQVKHVESTKTTWQQTLKGVFTLMPKAEYSVGRTGERAMSDEAVRFTSRIIQRQNRGVFWWTFHVDDEYETDCGVDLKEDSLPFAEISRLPSQNSPDQPLDKLTVEITSFWSLLKKGSGGWFSYAPGNPLPPGFSNLCQVGAPGTSSQASIIHSQSAISPTAAVLMVGVVFEEHIYAFLLTRRRAEVIEFHAVLALLGPELEDGLPAES